MEDVDSQSSLKKEEEDVNLLNNNGESNPGKIFPPIMPLNIFVSAKVVFALSLAPDDHEKELLLLCPKQSTWIRHVMTT